MADETVKDPFEREIAFHDRTWYGHIIKGHPDVEEYRKLVRGAISSPEEVRISRSDPDCRLYYGPGPWESVKMLVVVDIVECVVKTAHLAKRVSGGDREWPL